jgi:hypothetical protein
MDGQSALLTNTVTPAIRSEKRQNPLFGAGHIAIEVQTYVDPFLSGTLLWRLGRRRFVFGVPFGSRRFGQSHSRASRAQRFRLTFMLRPAGALGSNEVTA